MKVDGDVMLQLASCAKLNLFLEVLGKRSDGFHELETVMLRTHLCDAMRFEIPEDGDSFPAASEQSQVVAGSITLCLASSSMTSEPDFPLNESNLILKAAAALQRETDCQQRAHITIHKRIPAQAGLAGGSSNAATTLIGLNRLWSLQLPLSDLHRIAATLGSDINFFLEDCRAAVCRGRGEFVEPVPLRGSLFAVAVRPMSGNSTPAVFAQLSRQTPFATDSASAVLNALSEGNKTELQRCAFNRLTAAAQDLNPEMTQLMHDMEAICGRRVLMSGSGSTCFVMARSLREARILESRLRVLPSSFVSLLKI